MAVSGVSRSTSIYGNRNVLTGLASGMDTESMIENAISGYKSKITSLQQKRTKVEWQQESYRSIINKMAAFTDKYTSYRSANNLMSASFFDQAVKTVAKGKYADKVSATGRASSDVQIDRVLQLATAATYKLSGSALDSNSSTFGKNKVTATASGALDLDKEMEFGKLNGTVTLAYGGSNATSYLSLSFDETQTFKDAGALVEEINKQLSEQSISIGSKSYTGKELLENVVKAAVGDDGNITFTDPKSNGVYVSSATGTTKDLLLRGQEPSSDADSQLSKLWIGDETLKTEEKSVMEYLSSQGASMEITLDGVTKTIELPSAKEIVGKVDEVVPPGYQWTNNLKDNIEKGTVLVDEISKQYRDSAFMKAFQDKVDEAFGKGKLTVSDANEGGETYGDRADIRFQFEAAKGSTFTVGSSEGKLLGFGESERVTSYLNTEKTLGDLLGEKGFEGLEGFKIPLKDDDGNVVDGAYELDKNNNYAYEKDANGDTIYAFKVNGKEIGRFTKNSTLQDVMNAMNSNSDSGVKVSYSKLTNELSFTAKETGKDNGISFEGLSAKLFGAPGTYDDDGRGTYTKGQNAIFEATVNGTSLGQIERSSNSVEMDGMTVTLKGTFGYETDDNGNIKMSQLKDKNGNLVFSYGNDKEMYAKDDGSGKYQMVNKNGVALTYSSTQDSPLNGAEIYGKMVNGKLEFYATDKNGKETQLYARRNSSGNAWFSINNQDALNVTQKMDPTTAKGSSTEAVTFETSSDADKIVDVVKQMVADYNAMVTEIKSAYSTLPLQRSNGAYYEPLTDEDREDMSESAAEKWEQNAKTGILFGDRDLSNLYSRLTSAVSLTGEYGSALRAAGITVNYSNGLSTLEFNETDFRAALEKDPDKVRDAFVSSTDSGAKANGLMQALKQPLDLYGKTSGGKGVLVEKAGSPLAASTMYNNTIQKQLNQIDNEISRWEDKMSDQVDRYTNQFTRLEQLIQQMNSQSSYFSQLMGG